MKIRLLIRTKLILSFLAVVLIIGVASISIGIKIINDNVIGQAYDDVQMNLNTIKYFFNERIHFKMRFLEYLSYLETLRSAIVNNNRRTISEKLREVKREVEFDILTVMDARGKVIVRSGDFNSFGDDRSLDKYVKHVLDTKKPCYGTDIISRDELLKEGRELADRAVILVLETPRARKTGKKIEERGLVLKAAAPVIHNGRLIGVIYGAKLINNSFDLVDKFRNLVFKDEKIDGSDLGTATIFLDDIRVSTNVRRQDGMRAVGTRVSEEVYREVYEKGKTWLDKAFVVNKWYLSAYGPLLDIDNRAIGILYVGILEEKYSRILRNTTLYYLIIIVVTSIMAILVSVYIVNSVTRPAEKLIAASREIIHGNYQKILVDTHDEMGYLGSVFNNMVDAIHERDRQLKERTEKQIVKSAKLASLGRMASGIAHEINNPLTGILTYSSLLLEDLQGTDYGEDLQIIVNETLRCRKIVKGILDFARETKLEKQPANINDVIMDSLSMLEKLAHFQNVQILTDLDPEMPPISLDVTQMRSVINNLAINGADAMPRGGVLSITTRYKKEPGTVTIEVSDTGVGISEENIGKVFDPFFTTKEIGKGTGLGLAVTFGIVNRHNGQLDIRSKLGEGTTFIITLPEA